MDIQTEKIGELLKVYISGQLDSETSPNAKKKVLELIEKGEFSILLDLRHVDYITSDGLRFLLEVFRSLEGQSGKLAIYAVHPNVLDVLKISGMDRVVSLYLSEEEALDSFLSKDPGKGSYTQDDSSL